MSVGLSAETNDNMPGPIHLGALIWPKILSLKNMILFFFNLLFCLFFTIIAYFSINSSIFNYHLTHFPLFLHLIHNYLVYFGFIWSILSYFPKSHIYFVLLFYNSSLFILFSCACTKKKNKQKKKEFSRVLIWQRFISQIIIPARTKKKNKQKKKGLAF